MRVDEPRSRRGCVDACGATASRTRCRSIIRSPPGTFARRARARAGPCTPPSRSRRRRAPRLPRRGRLPRGRTPGSSSSTGMPASRFSAAAERTGFAPTEPTATRASATAPSSTRAQHATVAVGRSWNANFACADAVRHPAGAGTWTAVSSSPSPRLVWYGPTTKSPIGTRRDGSPPRRHSTSASSASRNVAGSECGSEKQRFPPSVPTSRTRRFATCRSIAASAGSRSRTSSERSSSRCVTVAPTTSAAVLRPHACELLDPLQVDEMAERRRSRA